MLWEPSGLAGLLHGSCRVPAWAAIAPMRPRLRAYAFHNACHIPPPPHTHTLTPTPPSGEAKEFTFKMTLGCVTAMVGFCMYSHTKIVSFRQQQARALAEAGAADEEAQPLKPLQTVQQQR